jgi:hypothetical protein
MCVGILEMGVRVVVGWRERRGMYLPVVCVIVLVFVERFGGLGGSYFRESCSEPSPPWAPPPPLLLPPPCCCSCWMRARRMLSRSSSDMMRECCWVVCTNVVWSF